MLQLAGGSHGSNDNNHQISASALVLVRLDHIASVLVRFDHVAGFIEIRGSN